MARSAIKAGDGAPQHFDGDKFLYFSGNLAKRNALRSICIEERNDEGFSPGKGIIYVYPDFNYDLTVLAMHPCFPMKRSVWKAGRVPKLLDHLYGKAKTVDEKCPEDVALFHEMLHWFHFLINYTRAGNDETRTDRPYCRLFEYYYGDQDNPNRANRGQVLDRLWGSKDFTGNRCHDGEELRTILGTPREDKHKKLLPGLENELEIENLEMTYYDYGIRYLKDKRRDRRYLHGDDLSENVYRLSVHGRGEVLTRMRFGHSNVTIPETDVLLGNKEILTVSETGGLYKNVFKLAHTVAMDCYKEITGKKKSDWELVPGQAAVEY